MKLSDGEDEDALEHEDFAHPSNFKDDYRAFYDDIKQPSDYIKEDW